MARDVLKTADLHGRKYSIDAVLAAAAAREATPTICISSSQVTPCESRRSDETPPAPHSDDSRRPDCPLAVHQRALYVRIVKPTTGTETPRTLYKSRR